MPKGAHVDSAGKQSGVPKPRLQRIVDERDGVRNDDLSA